jgi:alkylation response protein AidB-like acyl-CoA dehydrogenase
MHNFNLERLGFCMIGISMARVCAEEALKFAHRRQTFGQALIKQPVIREKLGRMLAAVESAQ